MKYLGKITVSDLLLLEWDQLAIVNTLAPQQDLI